MPILSTAVFTLMTVNSGEYAIDGSLHFELGGQLQRMKLVLNLPIDGNPGDIANAWYRVGQAIAEAVEVRYNTGTYAPVISSAEM